MNRTKIHWLIGDKLPKHMAIIEAVPGVGNVGKLVVDGLIKKHQSKTLGWILHPDLPPHATLTAKGLMAPPRIEIYSVLLPNNSTIIVIRGDVQPITAAGQFEVSEEILKLANVNNTPQLLVLAGLTAGIEEKEIHVICADQDVKKNLEANDIPVSKEQPKEGMIGIAGLIVSLSPIYGVPAVGLIADTVGTIADILAADRLSSWIEGALDIPLGLDLDSTKETAKRIMSTINVTSSIEDLLNANEIDSSSDFYV
jgi:proteasome assembly chaperone (PAC2) family protein|tara:strand:- start:16045 stop:16809 length:765 start_codon:yes stop_codon:yes gene_type:complete